MGRAEWIDRRAAPNKIAESRTGCGAARVKLPGRQAHSLFPLKVLGSNLTDSGSRELVSLEPGGSLIAAFSHSSERMSLRLY